MQVPRKHPWWLLQSILSFTHDILSCFAFTILCVLIWENSILACLVYSSACSLGNWESLSVSSVIHTRTGIGDMFVTLSADQVKSIHILAWFTLANFSTCQVIRQQDLHTSQKPMRRPVHVANTFYSPVSPAFLLLFSFPALTFFPFL